MRRSLMTDTGNAQVVEDIGQSVYAEYILLGKGKVKEFTFSEFKKVLLSFYDYTLDAFVFGDLKKSDGTYWDSRAEAIDAWAKVHKLTDYEVSVFFRANDNIETYS